MKPGAYPPRKTPTGRAPIFDRPAVHDKRRRKTRQFQMSGKELGAYLRASRLSTGVQGSRHWSLRAVAKRAEINHGLLSQIERGKRRPVADDLLRLADVLHLDREELLVRAGYLPVSALANRNPDRLSSSERKVVEALRTNPRLHTVVETLVAAFA
jgi:transcriptional regulator with XRE-family HTH domain